MKWLKWLFDKKCSVFQNFKYLFFCDVADVGRQPSLVPGSADESSSLLVSVSLLPRQPSCHGNYYLLICNCLLSLVGGQVVITIIPFTE